MYIIFLEIVLVTFFYLLHLLPFFIIFPSCLTYVPNNELTKHNISTSYKRASGNFFV